MTENEAPSPIVVGAGPTGLVAALTLAVNGVRCRVIDRRASSNAGSRALGCQARSMEVLAALGVVDPILRKSEPLGESVIMRGAKELVTIAWVAPDAPYPHTYVFRQPDLEAILREKLAQTGTEVEWNAEFVGLDKENAIVLADGRRVAASWIVGCDGGHSRVREVAGIAFEGRSTGEAHYLADVSFRQSDTISKPTIWLARDGPLMVMPLPGDPQVWRIFVDVTKENQPLPEPTRDLLQALLDRRALGPRRLTIDAVGWTSTYRTSIRLAHAYRHGTVLLAGDAAHVFPPYGGQGMNTGIQDAFNLGWKLARVIQGKSSSSLLDTYQAERRAVAIDTIRQVDQRRRLFAMRNPFARALRDLALQVFMRSASAKRAGSYATSELGISYHGCSWLCVDDGPAARPRAGDRAPDGPLGNRRLFEVLDPTRFTLLVFSDSDVAPAIVPELPPDVAVVDVNRATDPSRALTRRYDAGRGALVLVRPDGHIGLRGGLASHTALMSFLRKIGEARALGN
jgi:2-polyprenyl-6-methoxyphenol hydroxylase-like FAD-dependent oxidoreductase